MPSQIALLGMQQAANVAGTGMGLLLERHQDRRQLNQQRRLQNLEITGQKDMTDYNMSKQLQMWKDTNYPAQIEQLKLAGLNPGLIYGMSGGGATTTGQASGNVTGGHAPVGEQTASAMGIQMMQARLLEAQRENIEAGTEKTKAETANVPIAGKQMEATTASLTQGIQNQKAQEELTRVQSELTKVQASVARQTINDAMQTIENTAKQGTEILRGLKLQNDLSEQQFNDKLKLLKSEIGTIAVKNALMHAQRKNTDQDTKNKIQEILESEQRIKTMVNQIMIA